MPHVHNATHLALWRSLSSYMYMCTPDPDHGQSEGVCSCDYCEHMYSTLYM